MMTAEQIEQVTSLIVGLICAAAVIYALSRLGG